MCNFITQKCRKFHNPFDFVCDKQGVNRCLELIGNCVELVYVIGQVGNVRIDKAIQCSNLISNLLYLLDNPDIVLIIKP
jgi:hypothetical protein